MTTFTIPTETITENLTLTTTATTSIITTVLHTITFGHKGNQTATTTVTITEAAGTSEGISIATEIEQVFGFAIFLIITAVIEWWILRCRNRKKIKTAYSSGERAASGRAKEERIASETTLV